MIDSSDDLMSLLSELQQCDYLREDSRVTAALRQASKVVTGLQEKRAIPSDLADGILLTLNEATELYQTDRQASWTVVQQLLKDIQRQVDDAQALLKLVDSSKVSTLKEATATPSPPQIAAATVTAMQEGAAAGAELGGQVASASDSEPKHLLTQTDAGTNCVRTNTHTAVEQLVLPSDCTASGVHQQKEVLLSGRRAAAAEGAALMAEKQRRLQQQHRNTGVQKAASICSPVNLNASVTPTATDVETLPASGGLKRNSATPGLQQRPQQPQDQVIAVDTEEASADQVVAENSRPPAGVCRVGNLDVWVEDGNPAMNPREARNLAMAKGIEAACLSKKIKEWRVTAVTEDISGRRSKCTTVIEPSSIVCFRTDWASRRSTNSTMSSFMQVVGGAFVKNIRWSEQEKDYIASERVANKQMAAAIYVADKRKQQRRGYMALNDRRDMRAVTDCSDSDEEDTSDEELVDGNIALQAVGGRITSPVAQSRKRTRQQQQQLGQQQQEDSSSEQEQLQELKTKRKAAERTKGKTRSILAGLVEGQVEVIDEDDPEYVPAVENSNSTNSSGTTSDDEEMLHQRPNTGRSPACAASARRTKKRRISKRR